MDPTINKISKTHYYVREWSTTTSLYSWNIEQVTLILIHNFSRETTLFHPKHSLVLQCPQTINLHD
jgi:hypothetical protein